MCCMGGEEFKRWLVHIVVVAIAALYCSLKVLLLMS